MNLNNLTLDEALGRARPGLRYHMEKSEELLRKAEKLALRYDPENGYFLAFSGGKDSQALYHIAELAGVKFQAVFSPTTVDPPQVIRFIAGSIPMSSSSVHGRASTMWRGRRRRCRQW